MEKCKLGKWKTGLTETLKPIPGSFLTIFHFSISTIVIVKCARRESNPQLPIRPKLALSANFVVELRIPSKTGPD